MSEDSSTLPEDLIREAVRIEACEERRALWAHTMRDAAVEIQRLRLEIQRADRDADKCLKERDDALEFIEGVAALLGCKEEWTSAHDHRLCVKQAVMWGTGGEERAEVRKIVEAHENESTPDAVHRALRELFGTYNKQMEDVGRVAVEQIEGALNDGAIGMRDACLILVRAAGQGQPFHVATAMGRLEKAIEALPLP